IVQRMLCSEAKVDSQAVRTGDLSSSGWHRLTAAAGRLSEAQIFIDDSPGLTVLEARAKARRMKAEHGLELLIIDYLQLMRGRAAMESRQQEISEISRSLKALAKELGVPVVALSQLSRAVESRATRDFRPHLSDLRDSRALQHGTPLPTAQQRHERLGKATALAVFASDALSSVSYATEEILLVLILAGSAALSYSLPIAVAIAILIAIVVSSYRQTIRAYPQGGG